MIWAVLLAGVALGAAPLVAQAPPQAAGDRDLPVNVAGGLLDDALAQEVGGSQPVVLRRSRAGKIGLTVALAALLLGMRFLHKRRSTPVDSTEVSEVESVAVARSVRERDAERAARRDRLDRLRSRGRPANRPYRARRGEAKAPLAIPPHVLEILARTSSQGDPETEGGATPYHAPDQPPEDSLPAVPEEPPEQRLDLVVPGFTPWRNKK